MYLTNFGPMKSVCLGSNKRATNKDEQTWLRVTLWQKYGQQIKLFWDIQNVDRWFSSNPWLSYYDCPNDTSNSGEVGGYSFQHKRTEKGESRNIWVNFQHFIPEQLSWKRAIYFHHSTYRNHPQVLLIPRNSVTIADPMALSVVDSLRRTRLPWTLRKTCHSNSIVGMRVTRRVFKWLGNGWDWLWRCLPPKIYGELD